MMFHLETEFFSWDFLSWAINFLLAALAILIAGIALKGKRKLSFTKSEECGQGETELAVPVFEKCLAMFRKRTVDVWLGYPYIIAVAPLFFLALLLTTVYGN